MTKKSKKTNAVKSKKNQSEPVVFTWRNADCLTYRRYAVLCFKKMNILCRVDIRSTQTETVCTTGFFNGGWIELVEADGERLECSKFSPVSEEKESLQAMSRDADKMLEEAAIVLSTFGQIS